MRSNVQRIHLVSAIDVLLLPVIILGSIYGGIFTPTEASAVAVVYALVITAPEYRRQGFRTFIHVVARGCVTSAAILLVLAGAAVFGYAMTDSGIPQNLLRLSIGIEEVRDLIDDLGQALGQ